MAEQISPRADIDRIVYHARKRALSAAAQARVNALVTAFREVQLARSVEALVQWAYEEGLKDGQQLRDLGESK
jgi:hypothetical protein